MCVNEKLAPASLLPPSKTHRPLRSPPLPLAGEGWGGGFHPGDGNRQAGISLIEILMFIVIVGISVSGLLSVINNSARQGADPLIAKQATIIAEALLTEIEQMPFTWCDPQDANVTTAVNAAGCALPANDQNNGGGALGPVPAGETRGNAANPFDNVADYHNPAFIPAVDSTGAAFPVAGYATSVTITRAGAAAPFAALPLDAVLRIDVTVTGSSSTRVTVTGYRIRYAPNAPG